MRVKYRSVRQMEQLVLSSTLNFPDLLLTQSSRSRVGKLSRECRVMRACSRDGFPFNRSSQALHCFFNFRQLRHFLSLNE